MGIGCITERLDLIHAAREAGFLRAREAYRAALMRLEALAAAWRARSALDAAQGRALDELSATVAARLAAIAA